jgi:hypothetical protein
MSEVGSLESLQALYTDLLALSESRLSNLDRLGAQLDAHIQDFKNLLDKKSRNDQSRRSLATGMEAFFKFLHSQLIILYRKSRGVGRRIRNK